MSDLRMKICLPTNLNFEVIMKKIIIFFCVMTMIFSSLCVNASAAEASFIYVSPQGTSGGDGSENAPLSLKAAVEAIGGGNVKIMLKGGVYELDETLSLTAENGGNITFEACPGADVRISGAHRVDGWRETELNGVRAFEADAAGRKISGLFKDGKKLAAARLPEEGFFYVKSTNDEDNYWTAETTPNAQNLGSHSFNAEPSDLSVLPSNIADISVYVVHMWQEELSGVTSIDPKTGKVSLVKYSSHTIEVGDRFFFDNVKEALNKPGEWCFDSAEDKIYYMPQSDETVDGVELFASSVTKLVNIDGCDNVTFRRVIFENTGWEYASKEYLNVRDSLSGDCPDIDFSQAGVDVCAAVTAVRTKGTVFENCEFLNIGCTALRLLDSTEDCRVESCWFDDIGGSAVFAGGKNTEEECAKNLTVENCNIGNYGRRFYRAPGVILTFCSGAQVKNNEIHDGYYTGLSVGWMWLYGQHITHNINIENNLIYNIGQGMLSDMGGIYLLGVQPGSEVHGNVIHDVKCYDGDSGYAGTGLYTDAGPSEMKLYKNLVFNCSTAGFNATIGRNNLWYNNIVAFCGSRLVNPPQNYMDFVSGAEYRNNIFLTDQGAPVYVSLEESELFKESSNLMWDYSNGDMLRFSPHFSDRDGMTLRQAKRAGYIDGSTVIADPMFTDAENYDFTLKEGSPAAGIGFEEWDYSEAGTVKGTVVGISHTGGETAYNGGVDQCPYVEPQMKFTAKLEEFFMKIIRFFKRIFGMI